MRESLQSLPDARSISVNELLELPLRRT